jgi:hypothetical protein
MKKTMKIFTKMMWATLLALVMVIGSCTKSNDLVTTNDDSNLSLKAAVILNPVIYNYVFDGTCGKQVEDLIAGQNYLAGKVTITTTPEDKLLISLKTEDPWVFKAIHLYVGLLKDLPVTKTGNPVPGQFPVISTFTDYQSAITYEFNLSDIKKDANSCFIIALHADVYKLDEFDMPTQTETAWAQGGRVVVKGNWATYTNYCPVPCATPPGNECTKYQYETAFGGNTAGAGKAWWYYYDGVGEQNIYAGQSINIGTVVYDEGELTITLVDGWELDPATSESVKVQGYDVLPAKRPVAGLFTGYKGTSLIVEIGSFTYYVIHLDVRKCTSTASQG